MHDTIAILDFGGQYTHLISRRVRELGVYSEIFPFYVSLSELEGGRVRGIILSGGPRSVYEEGSPKVGREFFEWCGERGIPVLGICYGHQLIAHVFGGEIERGERREYGRTLLYVECEDELFRGLDVVETVWMSHGDNVVRLPEGFKVLGRTEGTPVAAYANPEKKVFGVQFHPEVAHTSKGLKILENFVLGVCGCKPTWVVESWVDEAVREVREKVKEGGNIIMAVSGGVDSTVAATIIHLAAGDRLHCVFVDNGLLRKGEAEDVVRTFREKMKFKNFHVVDAGDLFLERLRGVTDPEEKRRVIAHTFIEVFERKARELEEEYGEFRFLGQGTIYPDRVESAATSQAAARIKSHHNVTLPERMRLKLVEPLANLYKDEVRRLGEKLGIPREILWRHPFPGPSLAVRVLGEVTREKLEIVREADSIVEEEIRRAGVYERLWQAFAVLLPVKAVGVMGDARTYEYVVAVRAVESLDAMTANFAKLDWSLLERIASRIVNEVKGVNRVVYDVTNKPPATIEWE